MKPVHISEDILPIGEFKTHAARVLRRLREDQRPIVITQNGKPAGVLITPEEFDSLREREHFVQSVQSGLADSETKRVIDDTALARGLEAEFGQTDPA